MRVLSLATLLLLGNLCFSQDSLKTVQLEEVAITAVRASENVPIPKTNLTKKEIDEVYVGQHPIFLLEKSTPGLYSYSESGTSVANYGQLRLRGINQERINFTLNGVPLNDMIDQGVFFSNFTDISSNFESIQVQRGIGTSSNGVSSYGGSINFESLSLRNKEAFTRLQLGGGSFSTFRGNLQHFTGISEKGWGFMGGLSALTSQGYRDNTDSDAISFFTTGGYYGDKDLLKLTFFISRNQNGLGYQTIEESLLIPNPTINLLDENDRDDAVQFLGQLQYNRILNDNWTLGSTAYYGGANIREFTFSFPLDDGTLAATNFPLRNDHVGGILNLNYASDQLNITTGLHGYTFSRVNEEEEFLPVKLDPYYKETSKKNELSAFVKADYQLGNLTIYGDVQARTAKLSISPDYAFLDIADEGDVDFNWAFLNPRIGLTYDVSDAFSFYGSFGRSGREPTRIDYLAAFTVNGDNYTRLRNGGGFTEEYVTDLEIGARLTQSKLSIDWNYFRMSFEDEIAPIGEVIGFGLPRRLNIPESVRQGFEMVWAYQLASNLSWSGNLAYLTTEIKELELNGENLSGKEQALSPDWIINTQFNYSPIELLRISTSGRYLGEQFMEITNDPAFKTPSSFVVDFQVEATISPTITLTGYVNNLLDNEYYTFGLPSDADFSGTLERGFFAQPPRNYYLSLTVNF